MPEIPQIILGWINLAAGLFILLCAANVCFKWIDPKSKKWRPYRIHAIGLRASLLGFCGFTFTSVLNSALVLVGLDRIAPHLNTYSVMRGAMLAVVFAQVIALLYAAFPDNEV
jgi:hypothetical protein